MDLLWDGIKVFVFALTHLFEPQIDLYHHFLTEVPYFIHGCHLTCVLLLIIAVPLGAYAFIKYGIPGMFAFRHTDPTGFLSSIALFVVLVFITPGVIEQSPQEIYEQAMYIILWYGAFCYGYGTYVFVRRWSERPLIFLGGAILAYLVVGLVRSPWFGLLLTFLLFFWSLYSIGIIGIRIHSSCSDIKPEIGASLAFFFIAGAIYQPLYMHANYGTSAAQIFAGVAAWLAPVSIGIGAIGGALRMLYPQET